MNDQQIRSMLAKRAVQDKKEKTEAESNKKKANQHKNMVSAMHKIARNKK